jgi:hypothetical protein
VSRKQRDDLDEMLRAAPLDLGGDVSEQRIVFEEMMAASPIPADVGTSEGRLGGIRVVIVDIAGVESDEVMLYFHGGAYAIGSGGPNTIRKVLSPFAVSAPRMPSSQLTTEQSMKVVSLRSTTATVQWGHTLVVCWSSSGMVAMSCSPSSAMIQVPLLSWWVTLEVPAVAAMAPSGAVGPMADPWRERSEDPGLHRLGSRASVPLGQRARAGDRWRPRTRPRWHPGSSIVVGRGC